jgi:hypothetical protein
MKIMEKEKPYQPTGEEIKKAEGTMSQDQRIMSELREKYVSDPDLRYETPHFSQFDTSMDIGTPHTLMIKGDKILVSDYNEKHRQYFSDEVLTPEQALDRMYDAKEYYNKKVKEAEMRLVEAKSRRENVDYFEQKIKKLKEKEG